MKTNHSWNINKRNASDPTFPNYTKKIKNKANEKSPYGEHEPSTRTDFK